MAESPLGRLVGTWEFEPITDGGPPGRGRVTFEWIEDGAFLAERSDAEWRHPDWVANAPVSTRSVIGWDDSTEEIVQLYSDSRGVFRVYRGTLTDEAWTLRRAAEGFHQRFLGTFRDDGNTIEGRYDSSPDGKDWEVDFPITYRRIDVAR